MNKKIDYVDVVVKILIILGIVLVVYWFIQLMFGGSPSLAQLNTGLIFVLINLVVHLYYKIGKFDQFVEGTFPRFEENVKQSFSKIKEDMLLIKNDTDLIKKKLKV